MKIQYEGMNDNHSRRMAVINYRSENRKEAFAAEQIIQEIHEKFPQYTIIRKSDGIFQIYITCRNDYEDLKEYYKEAKIRVKRKMWQLQ